MNDHYEKILQRLEDGKPSVLLTYIPKESGELKKEIFLPESCSAETLELVRASLEMGRPEFREEAEHNIFTEPILPKAKLIILGGGHIALPLVEIAATAGFSVTVVDDRPSFANAPRFPSAERVICSAFEDSFDNLGLSEYDYVVVITRGHRHDALCLRNLLSRQETVYLGMIGSKRRVSGIKLLMREEGFDPERIERICTPIGLPIGAVTPEEIAVSIVAELIQCRRLGNGKRRVNHSELDPEVLRTITKRSTEAFAAVTVMRTAGSVPRGAGAKMLVFPDLSIAGSIGGGCSEGQIIRDAFSIIGTGRHAVKLIDLTGDVAESEGMVCGGTMEVLVEDMTERILL